MLTRVITIVFFIWVGAAVFGINGLYLIVYGCLWVPGTIYGEWWLRKHGQAA